ncbi:MAG: DNA polymerase III subunit gamma/tau [Janthinobacterium lividum]
MKTSTSYINFARKYRPNNLAELVGQQPLVKILNYSIINNRLAQGYLLTGIRGTGKTTSARIIAKTVNCSSAIIKDTIINPCEQCQNCRSFNEQKHPDIIEVDAASKTGVDDIREIIESSEYRPLLGKYKIFVIDEVHMLSKNAFNALLKVLEEPSPHVIFIFATTEVQKIPLTIISRCQRYDLRRLVFDEIFNLVKGVASKELINIEPEALQLIAIKSEGSAREAVALLDQVANFREDSTSNNLITFSVISQMLGVVDTGVIIKLFNYIIENNGIQIVDLINEIYQLSVSLESLIISMSDFIAYLSKVKLSTNYHISKYSHYENDVTAILTLIDAGRLSILWQIFYKGLNEIKTSYNQLVSCEMLFLKATYSYTLPAPEDLFSTDNAISPNLALSTPETSISASQINSTKEFDQQAANVNNMETKFIDFLAFLRRQREMDIYYQLFNEYELKNFENENFEIASENVNIKLKDQIASLLLKWSGRKWNVIIAKSSGTVSLKNQLVSKIESGKEWTTIKKFFPSANISDILMKK